MEGQGQGQGLTRRSSVHFSDADEGHGEAESHTNEILIRRLLDEHKTMDLHLGFLQIFHRYLISCHLKASDLPRASPTAIVQRMTEPPNIHLRFLELIPTAEEDVVEAKFELFAYKDKLLRETLFLQDEANPEDFTKVIFEARVLGKGKGTPLLKNGIHCTGKEPDPEESDVGSDWHGFA